MMKNILLFLAALIALCAASCTPNVVTTQRPGTFQQGGGTAAIFDIVISNAGSCPITSIIIDITLPTGATRGEYWNLVPEAGHYRVTSYEPQLPVGASVNAGLIVIFPNTVSAITVSLFSSVCPTSCTGTVAPTVTPTNPPTVRPTNPPTNTPTNTPTNPPTVRPTNPPTSPPSTTCRPSIVTTQRPATFPLNGGTGAIFDIVITNAGSCPITTIVIDITLPTGATRGEYWNLVPEAGHYRVTSYEPQLQVGATVNAGVIVIFPNTVSAITVSLFSAVCPVSCTGTAAPTVTPTNPPTVRPTNPPTNTPTNTPTNPPTVRPTNPPSNCRPSIVTTQRPGTFQQAGGTAAIFDIVITNSGSCPITTIVIDIALPAGSTRGEYWNLVPEAGHYRVTSYEPQLQVGATVNAGLIVIFPTSVSAISVNLFSAVCPATCI